MTKYASDWNNADRSTESDFANKTVGGIASTDTKKIISTVDKKKMPKTQIQKQNPVPKISNLKHKIRASFGISLKLRNEIQEKDYLLKKNPHSQAQRKLTGSPMEGQLKFDDKPLLVSRRTPHHIMKSGNDSIHDGQLDLAQKQELLKRLTKESVAIQNVSRATTRK